MLSFMCRRNIERGGSSIARATSDTRAFNVYSTVSKVGALSRYVRVASRRSSDDFGSLPGIFGFAACLIAGTRFVVPCLCDQKSGRAHARWQAHALLQGSHVRECSCVCGVLHVGREAMALRLSSVVRECSVSIVRDVRADPSWQRGDMDGGSLPLPFSQGQAEFTRRRWTRPRGRLALHTPWPRECLRPRWWECSIVPEALHSAVDLSRRSVSFSVGTAQEQLDARTSDVSRRMRDGALAGEHVGDSGVEAGLGAELWVRSGPRRRCREEGRASVAEQVLTCMSALCAFVG